MHNNRRPTGKPELLAPGGSLEKCKTAFFYGADAVYVGGKQYSLRAFATNLDLHEMHEACSLAHSLGKRLYVTVNTYPRETELNPLAHYLSDLQDLGVDGIIVSDPGALMLAKQYAPLLPIHLSTQANTTNSASIGFWSQFGVSRVNLARELSFDDIVQLRRTASVELEVFVHGAMCVSYSGRCLLSAFLNQRSANRGECTQPCRWSYRLVEEKRPGQYFPVIQDHHGTYIFNSKDLCLIADIERLIHAGLHSFKIEGRMKGILYLATVVRTYRQAIDYFTSRPGPCPSSLTQHWEEELESIAHRPYTKGLMFMDSTPDATSVDHSILHVSQHTLAGIVRKVEVEPFTGENPEQVQSTLFRVTLEVRSRLFRGQPITFLFPDGADQTVSLPPFHTPCGPPLNVVHPNHFIEFVVPFRAEPSQAVRTVLIEGSVQPAFEYACE